MDWGTWWATIHGVTKSQTWLSDFTNHKFTKNLGLKLTVITIIILKCHAICSTNQSITYLWKRNKTEFSERLYSKFRFPKVGAIQTNQSNKAKYSSQWNWGPGTLNGLPLAHMVKNLPGMQETQVRSLDREGPLEKGMTTHSNILAWRIPRTEKPGGLQFVGSQRVSLDLDRDFFLL